MICRAYIKYCKDRLQHIVDTSGYCNDDKVEAEKAIGICDQREYDKKYAELNQRLDKAGRLLLEKLVDKRKRDEEYRRRFLGYWEYNALTGYTEHIKPEIPIILNNGRDCWKWPEPSPKYYENKQRAAALDELADQIANDLFTTLRGISMRDVMPMTDADPSIGYLVPDDQPVTLHATATQTTSTQPAHSFTHTDTQYELGSLESFFQTMAADYLHKRPVPTTNLQHYITMPRSYLINFGTATQ